MYDEGSNESEDIYFSVQYTDADGKTQYAKIDTGTVDKGKWMQLSNTNYKIPADASDVVIYFETPDTTTSFYVDEVIAAPAGTKIDGPGKPKSKNSKQTYLKGDVDGDGVMDVYDLGLAKMGIVKGFDNKVAERCADIDENGTVEVKDIVQMGKFLLGVIKEFEVVEKVGPQPTDLSKDFANYKDSGSWKHEGENNPLTTQRFGADPGWMVYKDRLYIYTTNDAFEYYSDGRLQINTYNSGTINCISSADLVNWTDHGALPIAAKNGRTQGGCAKWANNAWAPDAEWKTIDGKDKFFLYFANNGSGVGVCVADSPVGPFRDELGHEVANSSVPGGQNVLWQFDPGVYLDRTTGEAYLAYGGGVPSGKNANPGTGRIGKLSDDMQHIEGSLKAMETPYLFEDSSLIKIGDTWYYSYCTNWAGGGNVNGVSFGSADICYMTSKDPMGPWTGSQLSGVVFKNTGTQKIDNGGNNHHSIIAFKGKYYVAYHSRQQALRMGITAIDSSDPGNRSKDSKDGNYRSTQLNEAQFSNGKLTCNGDMKGITKQLENVNPYTTVEAETMSNQSKGISVQGTGNTQVVAKANEWTKVSGVEFTGTKLVRVKASSKSGASIRISTGKVDGPVLAYVAVPAGGTMDEIEAGVFQNLIGVEDVYFSFSGDVTFDSWEVE
jgi:arabinoxylan arabinofuranohydrolase